MPVRGAGLLAVLQALSLFVPTFVLGAAIGWPGSLSDPASIALPRLVDNEGAVRLGYVAYLAYSLLFAVTITMIAQLVEGDLTRGLRRLVIGFAVASTIARSLGIVRWLAPMPELADAYASAADDGQRYAIERLYDVLNSYGGTIGEALGVGLFAAISIGALSVGLLRSRAIPRWIGIGGAVSTVALVAGAIELLGVDPGPLLTVTVSVVQLWFLAAGAWLLARGGRHFAAA
ncbi:MAG: DUF4386 domain-containing protein [Actinomycetales bacterium]